MTYENDDIEKAVHALQSGQVIVFPTDTAYGLGGDFQNPDVTDAILKIKKREDSKFTLIASSLEQVKKYFDLSDYAIAIASRYWPGPLSLVVSDRFSIRVPDNDIAREIAEKFESPIIATSANRSGYSETYTLQDAKDSLQTSDVAVWVDGRELKKRIPSTIISVNNNTVQVLREGAIELNLDAI